MSINQKGIAELVVNTTDTPNIQKWGKTMRYRHCGINLKFNFLEQIHLT